MQLHINLLLDKSKLHPILAKMANISHRNAGPTSELLSSKAQDARNEFIKEMVDYASFGDIKSKYCK